MNCYSCKSSNVKVSNAGYHNTVLVCQDCHSERQIYQGNVCQYCNEVKTSLDHICPVRVKELAANGFSPGKAKLDATELDRLNVEFDNLRLSVKWPLEDLIEELPKYAAIFNSHEDYLKVSKLLADMLETISRKV